MPQDHPPGFVAKPRTADDGSVDLLTWDCSIPGKEGTDWAGGVYPLTLKFTEDYPAKAPLARCVLQYASARCCMRTGSVSRRQFAAGTA